MDHNLLEFLSRSQNLLELLYKDIAQPGVRKVGKALETIFGIGNTFLLPIQMLNEKSRIIFENNMNKFKEKMKSKISCTIKEDYLEIISFENMFALESKKKVFQEILKTRMSIFIKVLQVELKS